MLAFGISNQGKKSFFQKYFSSHPPLSERIERLQQTNIATYSKQQTS